MRARFILLAAISVIPFCDNNCDDPGGGGSAPTDKDGDGYFADTDCDDQDPTIHPHAEERCDSIDRNCDGDPRDGEAVDAVAYFEDGDGDGYGATEAGAACDAAPEGYASNGDDCDDAAATVHPGAVERCDGIDNNCDGNTDLGDAADAGTYYLDADGDGFGVETTTAKGCSVPDGFAEAIGDCDDARASVYPGAVEFCDGHWNDCNDFKEWEETAEAGLVSFVDASGTWSSLEGTGDFADRAHPVQLDLDADGTLWFCGGTYYAAIHASGAAITVAGAKDGVTLDAGDQMQAICGVGGADLTVKNLAITGGHAGGATPDGGGVYCSDSTLTMVDVVLHGNSASEGAGGGVALNSCDDSRLHRVHFLENSAATGGALSVTGSSGVALTKTEMSRNAATRDGGGLFMDRSVGLTARNLTASSNAATGSGGALFVQASDATLTDSELSYNTAPFGAGVGATNVGAVVFETSAIHDQLAYATDGRASALYTTLNSGIALYQTEVRDNQVSDERFRGGAAVVHGAGIIHTDASSWRGNVPYDVFIRDSGIGHTVVVTELRCTGEGCAPL